MLASYRWSRLRGNFEGFYREDNGQSDPGITSLYDFPTNDPSYTAIGATQFGFLGDIRYLGARGEGFQTVDGFKTRTPFEYNTSLHADYAFKFGGQRLIVLADLFNLFNLQR